MLVPNVAVTVATVGVVTAIVLIVTVPVEEFAGIATEAGTEPALEFDESFTEVGTRTASPRVIVPTTLVPPTTEAGVIERLDNWSGSTVNDAV
jgi:hypothetical protein